MGKNVVKRIRFWDKIQYGFPSGKRQLVKKKGKSDILNKLYTSISAKKHPTFLPLTFFHPFLGFKVKQLPFLA